MHYLTKNVKPTHCFCRPHHIRSSVNNLESDTEKYDIFATHHKHWRIPAMEWSTYFSGCNTVHFTARPVDAACIQ